MKWDQVGQVGHGISTALKKKGFKNRIKLDKPHLFKLLETLTPSPHIVFHKALLCLCTKSVPYC